jgi:hypothetical protein
VRCLSTHTYLYLLYSSVCALSQLRRKPIEARDVSVSPLVLADAYRAAMFVTCMYTHVQRSGQRSAILQH